jgi:hypothetical protein
MDLSRGLGDVYKRQVLAAAETAKANRPAKKFDKHGQDGPMGAPAPLGTPTN